MSETKFKWYVMRAISGKEHKVKEYIDAEMAQTDSVLKPYVSQVLIPTEKYYATRNGKRVIKERNNFPGYVLVECNLVDECFPRLRNVPNVLGFLGEKKNTIPSPIRPEEVRHILGNVDAVADPEENLEVPYVLNERVKVTDGPFKGMIGTIDEIMEEKKKLRVSVLIFGRKTPVELGYAQVEKEE